jgi:hypothetical protein
MNDEMTRVFIEGKYGGGTLFSVPRSAVGEFISLLSTGLDVESKPDYSNRKFKMAEESEAMTIQIVPDSKIEFPVKTSDRLLEEGSND